jgi:hypothetical protein
VALLRITIRCEADFAVLDTTEAEALIEKFYELRGREPDGGEAIAGLVQRVCKSLHAGRYRAVTWYDREHDVVWLLAVGIHRADSQEDVYNQAIKLEQAGKMYPTADDYAALPAARRRQRIDEEAGVLMRFRDQLLQAATNATILYNSPDNLHIELSAEIIEELAEMVLRVRMQRRGPAWLTEQELEILLTAVYADHAYVEQTEPLFPFRRFTGYVPYSWRRTTAE